MRSSTMASSRSSCVGREFESQFHVPPARARRGRGILRHPSPSSAPIGASASVRASWLAVRMVGQRTLVEIEASALERRKKCLRLSDCRRLHARARRRTTSSGRRSPVDKIDRVPQAEARATDDDRRRMICGRGRSRSRQTSTTACTVARRDGRLAQRTRRQQVPVAKADGRIDHDDLAAPRQTQVLQAVVADHDIGSRLDRRLRRRERGHDRRRRCPHPRARAGPPRRRRSTRPSRASTSSGAPGVRASITAQHDADAYPLARAAVVRARPRPVSCRCRRRSGCRPRRQARDTRCLRSSRTAIQRRLRRDQMPGRRSRAARAATCAVPVRTRVAARTTRASFVELQAMKHRVLSVAREQLGVRARLDQATRRP